VASIDIRNKKKWRGSGAPPIGVGGTKNFLLLKEQKETMATSRDPWKYSQEYSRKPHEELKFPSPDRIGGLLRSG
jgi:hypothetical protein